MEKEIIDYLNKSGYSVVHVTIDGNNFYAGHCRDFRRFIWVQWDKAEFIPDIDFYACDDKSFEKSREWMGYSLCSNVKGFKGALRYCYVQKYGWTRWIFRQIFKPFFKYLTPNETKYNS